MNKDIKDAIKKNLSQEVAGALKERLEELEVFEQEVPELRKQVTNLLDGKFKLETTLSKHHEIDAREKSVKKGEDIYKGRITAIEQREAVLKIREDMADKRVDDHINMFELVFRNQKISQNVTGTANNGQEISRTNTTEVE